MTIKFEQLSSASGFMKHNGGLLFRTISEDQYEFKTIVTENHLNRVKITHGGYIASIIDAGLGTAASRCAGNVPCVTISLDIKYIAPTHGLPILDIDKTMPKVIEGLQAPYHKLAG